ncbi:unnamed protein product [Effrenium voratum]|nr:unnamed protein product [Effrenium voratum]
MGVGGGKKQASHFLVCEKPRSTNAFPTPRCTPDLHRLWPKRHAQPRFISGLWAEALRSLHGMREGAVVGGAEGKEPKAKASAAASASLVLFVVCWCKGWVDLLGHGQAVLDGDHDILHSAPLAAQLAGLVMTNLLGAVFYFRRKNWWGGLCACLDLDTWYLLGTQGPEILRAEAKDWEHLRLRTSIWRSLPLACIGFYLATRDLFEMPLCQMMASTRATLYHYDFVRSSPWLSAMEKAQIDPSTLTWVQMEAPSTAAGRDIFPAHVFADLRGLEESIWSSCHCSQSRWSQREVPFMTDMAETWLGNFAIDSSDGTFGITGTGTLFALNQLVVAQAKEHLLEHDELLVSFALDMAWASGNYATYSAIVVATHMMTEGQLVEAVQEALREDSKDKYPAMSSTVQQSRSCLFQILWAGIQLLNSVNPIAAHVCKARNVRATGRKAAVSLHAMMDTSLLVLTLILASQQCGLAKAVGSMLSFPLESLFRNLPTVVDNLSAQRMASSSEVAPVEAKEASRQMVCSIMGKDIPAVAAGVLQTVHDYVAVSPRVFGLTISGVVLFCGASFVLAKVLRPEGLQLPTVACLNAGICGPLFLLASVDRLHVEELCPYITSHMCLRGCILSLMVFLAWRNVETDSAEFWYATVFNEVSSCSMLRVKWLCLVLLHGLTGRMAVNAIKDTASLEELPLGAKDYKTFQDRPVTCGAVHRVRDVGFASWEKETRLRAERRTQAAKWI